MRVLALESSGLTASVAIVEEEQTVAEYTVNYKKTHSQTLLPMLDEVAKMVDLDLGTIDAIAISGGPGSFTGLRIGSATAKGLGLALKKPLVHVPTLEGMAYNLYGTKDLICPIMDARRNQVYTGIYSFEGGFHTVLDQQPIGIGELMEKINEMGKSVIFLGDGVPVHKEYIEQNKAVQVEFAPPHMNRQRAASVGMLGLLYLQMGKTETAVQHQPNYLRVSQAERELAEKQKKEQG